MLTASGNAGEVFAAPPSLKIYDYSTKKTTTYTDKQIKYVYNGVEISLPKTPGILSSNGVALGPYYDIFVKKLGIKCTKDASAGTLTFTKGSNTLVMKINSKEALLNGKSVTANAAPVNIRYKDTSTSRILVPTRFVAESFGYSYTWNSETSTVTIKSALTLQYNGKQVSYLGKTGQVTTNGKKLSLSKLPSILMSNTAMVRAYTVFKTALGVNYSYNRITGQIVFRKGNIIINMQEGSTIAYINNEIKDCQVAPVLVKNCENNYEALLVPGRFVAENLGYDYTWDAGTNTSIINTTDKVGVYVPPYTETENKIIYSFAVDEQKILEYENILNNTTTDILGADSTDNIAIINDIRIDEEEIFNETYNITFSSPFQEITSSLEGKVLTLTLKNTWCRDNTVRFLASTLVNEIVQKYDQETGNTILSFEFFSEEPYFNLSASEDGLSCSVTIYPNYLVGIEYGVDLHGEYLSFKGLKNFNYEIDSKQGYDLIQFKDTANTLGNIIFPDELLESFFQYAVMVESDPTQINLSYITKNNKPLVFISRSNELKLYCDYKEQNIETNKPLINQPLNINLPTGITKDKVSVKDDYLNRQIVLTLPGGDFTQYYAENPIENTYAIVNDIKVVFDGSDTKIKILTSKVQGFTVSGEKSFVSLKIANPSQIYKKIIVLDAGHGGIDPGAMAGGYNEKDINFTILNTYAKEYFDKSDIKVYYTRLTDTKIDLYDRADFASEVEADMFISLHMNAASSTSANGTAVYYSTLNTSMNSGRLSSQIMASTLVKNLVSLLGTKNNGTPTANFVVIRETQVPAVLIELAFLTNKNDRNIITDKNWQKKTAKTIFDSVVSLFESYPVKR